MALLLISLALLMANHSIINLKLPQNFVITLLSKPSLAHLFLLVLCMVLQTLLLLRMLPLENSVMLFVIRTFLKVMLMTLLGVLHLMNGKFYYGNDCMLLLYVID